MLPRTRKKPPQKVRPNQKDRHITLQFNNRLKQVLIAYDIVRARKWRIKNHYWPVALLRFALGKASSFDRIRINFRYITIKATFRRAEQISHNPLYAFCLMKHPLTTRFLPDPTPVRGMRYSHNDEKLEQAAQRTITPRSHHAIYSDLNGRTKSGGHEDLIAEPIYL